MRGKIDIRQLILGKPSRLRYIERYSTCPRSHPESVAEHSWYVAFYALVIGKALNVDRHTVDLGLLVGQAIMHDVDECFSGDFIRMFKHSSETLKQEIDKACQSFIGDFVLDLCGDVSHGHGADLMYMWKNAKEATHEGLIVGFCDFLSVVSYVVQEIESGNHVMYEQLPELNKFYHTFHNQRYDFIRPWVQDVAMILSSLQDNRVTV